MPTIWEYKIVEVGIQTPKPYNQIFTDVLNQNGREGWEHYLIDRNAGTVHLFFKRPM